MQRKIQQEPIYITIVNKCNAVCERNENKLSATRGRERATRGREPPNAMRFRYADTQKCAIYQNVPVFK